MLLKLIINKNLSNYISIRNVVFVFAMIKNICFVIFFTTTLFNAQNNRDKRNYLVYAAQVSLYDKKYDDALKYFKKAFNYAPPQTSYELLTASSVALKLKKIKLADTYLKQAVTRYKVPLELINSYSTLLPYADSKPIKKINNSYKDLIKEYYFQLQNINAYLQVEQLLIKDQFVRSLPNYYFGISNKESVEMLKKYIDAVNKKDTVAVNKYSKYVNFNDENFENLKFTIMKNTDSLNIEEYIGITKKYGYLENGWILLWHHRLTYGENNFVWNFFKPYISSEIEKGNMERDFFAVFEDEYNISNFGKQKYGTESQFEQYPIENIKDVDILRAKVGLPPLYYDKIIYDIDIPKEYIIDDKKFREAIFSKIKSL